MIEQVHYNIDFTGGNNLGYYLYQFLGFVQTQKDLGNDVLGVPVLYSNPLYQTAPVTAQTGLFSYGSLYTTGDGLYPMVSLMVDAIQAGTLLHSDLDLNTFMSLYPDSIYDTGIDFLVDVEVSTPPPVLDYGYNFSSNHNTYAVSSVPFSATYPDSFYIDLVVDLPIASNGDFLYILEDFEGTHSNLRLEGRFTGDWVISITNTSGVEQDLLSIPSIETGKRARLRMLWDSGSATNNFYFRLDENSWQTATLNPATRDFQFNVINDLRTYYLAFSTQSEQNIWTIEEGTGNVLANAANPSNPATIQSHQESNWITA